MAMSNRPFSADAALIVLTLCAMGMALLNMGHDMVRSWRCERADAAGRTLALAESYGARQNALTTSAHALLRTLALAPEVREGDSAELSAFMRNLNEALPEYQGIAVFDARGGLLAFTADDGNPPPEVEGFGASLRPGGKKRSFSVGESFRGSDDAVLLPMSLPVPGLSGSVRGVIASFTDMSGVARISSGPRDEISVGKGRNVYLLDSGGRVMYRHGTDPAGEPALGETLDASCFRAGMAAGEDAFVAEDAGDGKTCAVLKLRLENDAKAYMYVLAQEENISFQEFLFSKHLNKTTAMAGSLAFALAVAVIMGRHFFAQGLGRLAQVADLACGGDSDARNGALRGCREIQLLGRRMDQMLDALREGKARLHEQGAGLELALEAARQGIWRWRAESDVLQLDARGWESFGYAPQEREDANLLDALYPKDEPDFHAAMVAHLTGRVGQFRKEARVRCQNGALLWVLFVGRVVKDIGEVWGVCSDITPRKRLEELERERAEYYRQLSSIDGLTGLWNRRGFDEMALAEMERALRYDRALTIVMADVDHFKRINDAYGHAAGDEVLRILGQAMRRLTRSSDRVARFGGEEFVILLPETSQRAGLLLAEKIREVCERLAVPYGDISIFVTISFGLCTHTPSGKGGRGVDAAAALAELLVRADEALYAAKNGGRNKVMSCGAQSDSG